MAHSNGFMDADDVEAAPVKKRSASWAVIRNDAPKMPWDDDPAAVVFPRLAASRGTLYALRMWDNLQQLAAILDELADVDDARVEVAVRRFFDSPPPAEQAHTAQVYKLCRVVAGGLERQAAARAGKTG